jgi:hypothetical protein
VNTIFLLCFEELGLREGSKKDSSTSQADSFADEREEKASACSGPACGGQAEWPLEAGIGDERFWSRR